MTDPQHPKNEKNDNKPLIQKERHNNYCERKAEIEKAEHDKEHAKEVFAKGEDD